MDVNRIRSHIDRMTNELLSQQWPDGAWRLCFDSGTMTDSYFIIVLRLLGSNDETFIRSLAERIASKQLASGAWKIYPDEKDGNLETTAEACFALLYSGYYSADHPQIILAKQFIRSRGGLSEIRSMLSQAIFAVTGQAEWPSSLRLPLEAFFANQGIGIDLFSISGHARVHLVPILILGNGQVAFRTLTMPDLSDLFLGGNRKFSGDSTWLSGLIELIQSLSLSELLPLNSPAAKKEAEQFMLDRLEPNGTLLTYSTATMFMILALLALGHQAHSPLIYQLTAGIRSLMCRDRPHIQVASSEVWDTAMLSYAMREAGMEPASSSLERAADYLIARQQTKEGDWAIRNPGTPPGGWGFSDVNTLYPDVDDSTASLRSIRPYLSSSNALRASWQRGLNWVLSMRNKDGGWPAFERKGSSLAMSLVAFEGAADIAADPSTVDLTGRTLLFLGKELDMNTSHGWIDQSVRWLLSQQERDGSWYGRWGIAYTHGTGAAVQGLMAVGVADDHPAVRKAVKWLLSIQNADGGWGESCLSDQLKKYVPLQRSTPSQTAWALDALTAANAKLTPEIERGIEALLLTLDIRDWTYTYPTGAGLPGSVYVHYPSNNYIWPLLTLSTILKKYGDA